VPALPLRERRVEKPWGRNALPAAFDPVRSNSAPIGEIIFENPPGGPSGLIIKYLFTSERLSVQVHPDDSAARARGLPNGKDEGWVVIEAQPDATLGLGLREPATREELRQAALAGTIDRMVDWQPVSPGDCIYSPGGTIHAIGAGVAVVEVQQNSDVTFRLFDYGRDRELQLDEGLAVADLGSKPRPQAPKDLGNQRTRLVSGRAFQVERIDGPADGSLSPPPGSALWLLPLAGTGAIGDEQLTVGGCWLLAERGRLDLDSGASLLIAYSGAETCDIWRR
jgi:mannose-6-phosphate isomerase